jgi:hypothetical protein
MTPLAYHQLLKSESMQKILSYVNEYAQELNKEKKQCFRATEIVPTTVMFAPYFFAREVVVAAAWHIIIRYGQATIASANRTLKEQRIYSIK